MSSQRAIARSKEPEILKRRGDRRLLRPVWVATQGFEFEVKSVWADAHDLEFEFEFEFSFLN